jgi:DNA-binding LytR/AlgR family response regulator
MSHEQKLRLLLVDDEPLARERARRLLERVGDVEIVGEAQHGREALARIEELQPDVLLLDINMPELDGLRLLEALDDPPAVIFATAHEHHAVRAFDLEAVDYLLKPFSAERLKRALDRVRRQFALGKAAGAEGGKSGRIPAENGRSIELLPPERIVAARIDEGVVFLLRDDGEKLTFAGSLQELEEQLPLEDFLRASRRSIVQVAAIERFVPTLEGGLLLYLRGGAEEVVSRRRARFFRSRLG